MVKKIGLRILISLLAGGAIQEIIHISTGDPNRPTESNYTLLYAILVFILLTFITFLRNWTKSR